MKISIDIIDDVQNTKKIMLHLSGELIYSASPNFLTTWFTPDEADKVAFQINSALQEMELTKGAEI